MVEEERYSNRQIERLLDEQSKDIKEHIDQKTQPILNQVTKTNGRVNVLEAESVVMKVWKGWQKGGMAAIMVVLPVITAILAWMALQIVDLKTNQQQFVDQAVSASVTRAFQQNLYKP